MSSEDDHLRSAVEILALASGGNPHREGKRFLAAAGAFRKGRSPRRPFELVLHYSGGALRRFGYLTAGAVLSSLDETIRFNLSAAIHVCLDNGGTPEDAGLLSDVVGLAFPDRSELSFFAPGASAALWGFTPGVAGLATKVYLSTRLASSPHRSRVMAVLRRALPDEEGSAAACYECLYEENREARFRGVGVDVGPAGRGRVKFYVRVSRQDAAELLGAAARLLARIDPAFDGDDLLRRARDLHSALKGSAAERAEIATAFESDGAPSLKIVFFLLPGGKFEERLGIGNAALERLGADPGPLRDVCRSVVGGLGTGDRASPIHALGLESGGRTSNRVNVYVQPVPTP